METLEEIQMCEKECQILEEMSHRKGQGKKMHSLKQKEWIQMCWYAQVRYKSDEKRERKQNLQTEHINI